MTIAINGDATRFTQWDTGWEVTCETDTVRFFLAGSRTAYEVEAEDGVAAVPDELLQSSGDLVCYEVSDGIAGDKKTITIVPCAKPTGYVFSETNRATIDDVQEALTALVEAEEERASAAEEGIEEKADAAQSAADVALHSNAGYCESTSGYVKLGRDLSEAFADEIGEDEPIEWLQSRASAGNFEGLAVGDYLAVTLADDDSTVMNYQIAGFDMYYGVGDTANGHHITMVPAIVYPEYVVFNETADDNGDETDGSPWLESHLYTWMNETFYGYLPSAWQGALKNLRVILPTRYSSSGSLTDDAGYEWADLGYVWAPSEREVWGDVRRGTLSSAIPSTDRQLPIFQRASVVRSRSSWWERCAAGGSSTSVCNVNGTGIANAITATYSNVRPLPCFHIG